MSKKKSKGLVASLRAQQERVKREAMIRKLENTPVKAKYGGAEKTRGKYDTNNNSSSTGSNSSVKKITTNNDYIPFDAKDKILLVGEGDFSFSVAIVNSHLADPQRLIVTSYDTREQINSKYPNSGEKNLAKLQANGFEEGKNLFFKIDCTKLTKSFTKKQFKHLQDISCVVFNFPHNGRGIKDVMRSIAEHQKLVSQYFANCIDFYGKVSKQTGKVVITLFEGEPYDSWQIKRLARNEGLKLARSGNFNWDIYPGYLHRKTNNEWETTKPQRQRRARVYCFDDKGVIMGKKKVNRRKNNDNDSESDGD